MGALYCSMSIADVGNDNGICLQFIQAYRDADDIGDGLITSHFMKMKLFQ